MEKIKLAHACLLTSIASVMLASVSLSGWAFAQNASVATSNTTAPQGPADPGVRGGAPGAGGPLPGLRPLEQAFFNAATGIFTEVETVPTGLGPRFNLDSCGGCHAQPAAGGSRAPTTLYRHSSRQMVQFARHALSATRMERLMVACTTCL